MVRRKMHEEFVKEVEELVGEEYAVIGKYIKSNTHIRVKHNECGYEYDVVPNSFLIGRRCPSCSIKVRIGKTTKSHETFVKEVYNAVNCEYEVKSKYINNKTHIKMRHNECGYEYEVKPYSFLNGRRCPRCSIKAITEKIAKSHDTFVKEVYNAVNCEYEVKSKYINNKTHIRVKHNKCGYEYEVRPDKFLQGKRCPKCSIKIVAEKSTKTHQEFVNEVFSFVGNKYAVIGEYIKSNTHIRMKHNECGYEYDVRPNDFLSGKRCPKCRESKGEKEIFDFLERINVDFKNQFRIESCKYKLTLPFDFAVFKDDKTVMILIEFDGEQHYKPVEHFGGEKVFKETKLRDNIKTEYCKNNNIPLIRIPYWEEGNVASFLTKEILSLAEQKKNKSREVV